MGWSLSRVASLIVGLSFVLLGLRILRRPSPVPQSSHTTTLHAWVSERGLHTGPHEAELSITAPGIINTGQSSAVTVEASKPAIPLAVNLAAAGMDVEPKDWIRLEPSSPYKVVGRWSIHAGSPGDYHLVFNAKVDAMDPENLKHFGRNAEFEVIFNPNPDIPVTVVRSKFEYLRFAWGACVTFMGSLLTLPGILAFLKNRKREKGKEKRRVKL